MAQKLLSKKARRRRLFFRIFLLCVVLGFLAGFLYVPFFRITGLEIHGARHTNISAVEQDIRNHISGYRFGIIPNDHILLYRKTYIERYILQTYPSVETIDIRFNRHRSLDVYIQDRKPLGVWCDEVCYLYDVGGVIFKKSFMYTGALFVSWKKEASTPVAMLDTVSCQELCTDSVFMDFLKTYRIEKAVMTDNQLVLTSTDGYYIKAGFEASSTMQHIADVLKSKPDLLKQIEYIDVRFENKIFYKEREE